MVRPYKAFCIMGLEIGKNGVEVKNLTKYFLEYIYIYISLRFKYHNLRIVMAIATS